MPATKLASPTVGMTVEELTDLMFKYYRELEYLLNGNLDEQNVRQITTDLLVAGTAKISTALIEDLVVGGNVTMGPLATISWDNVTDRTTIHQTFNSTPITPYYVGDVWFDGPTGDVKRCIVERLTGSYNASDWELATKYNKYTDTEALAAWVASGYKTYIDDDGVYTGTVVTNQLVAGSALIGTALIDALTVGDNVAMGPNAYISWANVTDNETIHQTFTATPTTPYYVGDMWTAGPTGDLKRCKTQKLTGAYDAADWELASKYTDDTTANGVDSALSALKTNLGYTYISGQYVISPHIVGGDITSNTTINVGTNIYVGKNMYLGVNNDTDAKIIVFSSGASIANFDGGGMSGMKGLRLSAIDVLLGGVRSFGTSAGAGDARTDLYGYWDFSRANIIGNYAQWG